MKDPNINTHKFGVLIGRFCPIHKGHQQTIELMLEECNEHSILLIGSCNTEWTLRNFFNYGERRKFIKTLYPNLKIAGLPDFPNDDEQWLMNLIDLLESVIGNQVHIPVPLTNEAPLISQEGEVELVFYGGSMEDMYFLNSQGFKIRENNRFENGFKTSAQEMRDALIHGRNCDHIDPKILPEVQELFHVKWEKFKKR